MFLFLFHRDKLQLGTFQLIFNRFQGIFIVTVLLLCTTIFLRLNLMKNLKMLIKQSLDESVKGLKHVKTGAGAQNITKKSYLLDL